MPLIGFTVFKDKILDGTKRQTIRKLRKHPIKVGDKLYLYWHLRQKDCIHLMNVICKEVFIIQISSEYWVGKQRIRMLKFENGEWMPMSYKEQNEIATEDGFHNDVEMLSWFIAKYPLPETFQVIRW